MLSKYSYLILLFATIDTTLCENKYSYEANRVVSQSSQSNQDNNPFRMLKLNELWQKAVKRLEPQKLKNLMSDLKLQDKDELTFKKLKSEGMDKDGLKEAELRRRLSSIMEKYGLNDYTKTDNNANNVLTDAFINKQIFKDKKLDKLWQKAEKSGLNDEQLKILKEEFRHHENKIEQYYQIINDITRSEERLKGDIDNSINNIHEEDVPKKNPYISDHIQQALREKHLEIKDNYRKLSDNIYNITNDRNDFEEPQAQRLWDLVHQSAFNDDEKQSLREELQHFQNRVKKLKHFEAQLEGDINAGKYIIDESDEQTVGEKHLKKKVKELNYKVNKIHNELETRIMQRHIEL